MKYTPGELIGDYVRQRRLALGMSQVEFGERCGFYQTYLSRVERGRANPSLNALEVLAATLGMSVFELFDAAQKAAPRLKHMRPQPVAGRQARSLSSRKT